MEHDADHYGLCTHCDCFVRHRYWDRHCITTKHLTNVKKSIREENARASSTTYDDYCPPRALQKQLQQDLQRHDETNQEQRFFPNGDGSMASMNEEQQEDGLRDFMTEDDSFFDAEEQADDEEEEEGEAEEEKDQLNEVFLSDEDVQMAEDTEQQKNTDRYQKYVNRLTLDLLAFTTIANLSTSMKQWLLHMFACAQQSSSLLLPPTAYLLDQVKASLLPPQFRLTGTVSAKKSQKTRRSKKSTDEPLVEIEYQDILKVAEDLLNSADGDLHWTYEENEGTVEDRWHTKGWKQYEQFKRRMEEKHGKPYTLIMPSVWVDGMEQTKSTSVTSICLTMCNLDWSKPSQNPRRRLLALLPPDADIMEAVDLVVVQPLRKLEKGVRMRIDALGGETDVIGSLFSLEGDHMGQIALMGVVGPNGLYPSKYSLVPAREFCTLDWSTAPYPGRRTRSLLKQQSALVQRIKDKKNIGNARKQLKNIGMTDRVSCLSKLSWFRFSFFDRFPICALHFIPLNLVKRFLEYYVLRYGKELMEVINARIASYPRFPGLRLLKRGLIRICNNKKHHNLFIPGDGAPLSSFLQICPAIMLGLFDDQDAYRFWCLLSLYYNILVSRYYSPRVLHQQLPLYGKKIRQIAIRLFGKGNNSNIEFNLSFPYFELFDHVSHSLEFVGSGDTSVWEQQNKFFRRWARSGNGRKTELTVMDKVALLFFALLYLFFCLFVCLFPVGPIFFFFIHPFVLILFCFVRFH
ncbi:X-linked retinitis pigmentosa GTPase regulator isoform X1, variant 2 [Balamuthia mandrillaris]